MNRRALSLAVAVAATCVIGVVARADVEDAARGVRDHMHPFANPSGYAATYSTAGFIDRPTRSSRILAPTVAAAPVATSRAKAGR